MRGLPRSLAVAAVAAAAIALAAALAVPRILDRGRAHSAGDFFSVALPAGWQIASTSTTPTSGHADTGAMSLRGPSGRSIEINWTDGAISYGFTTVTPRVAQTIPLTIAGQPFSAVDELLVNPDGSIAGRRADVTGITRSIRGRSVGFVASCEPTNADDSDYSWCIAILNSWQWG